MNREILIALAGTLLALGTGYFFLKSNPDAVARKGDPGMTSDAIHSEAQIPPHRKAPKEPRNSVTTNRTPLEAAEAEWELAATSHREAERALKVSEQALDDVEREVDAVDRFIEDLEERGEDPANYAEEGMAKLRPAIERFEARLEIVERSERLEAEARSRLEAAEAELARQRTLSP